IRSRSSCSLRPASFSAWIFVAPMSFGVLVSAMANCAMAFSRASVPAVYGSSKTCCTVSLRLVSCSKRWAWTDARDEHRAEFALGARHTARSVHDGVEGGRALAQYFRLMAEEQVIVRGLGLGGAFLKNLDLIFAGLVEIDDIEPGMPLQHFVGETM